MAESNTLGEYYARNVKLGWSDAVKATPEQVAEAVANERVKDEPDPGMWSEVGRGTKVIVEETLGQRLDGEFIRTESDDDGLLVVVQITGERKHRRFPEDAVTVVGEVVEQEA